MSLLGPVQVVAVTGGKGGVGKTFLTTNLAAALAARRHRVLLFDADLGLANVDIMLGLRPKHTLLELLEGKCRLNDILIEGPYGLQIVPATSGVRDMSHLTPYQHAGIIHAFSELERRLDFLFVDTAAGINDSVVSFTQAAREVLVVVCNEPTSITDAYALIKVLNREHGIKKFRILSNMTRGAHDGRQIFAKLLTVTERFLDVYLEYLGQVPRDEQVSDAIRKQQLFIDAFPRSPAAIAIKGLAKQLEDWPLPQTPAGHIEFFMERLVQQVAT